MITIFGTILLVFAFIAVFVSAFIINNTFQIILSQRVRELGLWRAVGATPKTGHPVGARRIGDPGPAEHDTGHRRWVCC